MNDELTEKNNPNGYGNILITPRIIDIQIKTNQIAKNGT